VTKRIGIPKNNAWRITIGIKKDDVYMHPNIIRWKHQLPVYSRCDRYSLVRLGKSPVNLKTVSDCIGPSCLWGARLPPVRAGCQCLIEGIPSLVRSLSVKASD